MEPAYPGPYCQALGVTFERLKNRNLPEGVFVTNGLVLELNSYAKKENLSNAAFVKLLSCFNNTFSDVSHPSSVLSKVKRIVDQKGKLGHKKKVKGVKNIQELLEQAFQVPVQSRAPQQFEVPQQKRVEHSNDTPTKLCRTVTETVPDHKVNEEETRLPLLIQCEAETQTNEYDMDGSVVVVKNFNLLQYKHSQLEKKNRIITRKLNAKRVLLGKVVSSIGHYSVRNVNKRDDTARKNLHLLRDTQRANLRLQKSVKKKSEKIVTYKSVLKDIKQQNENLEKANLEMKEQLSVANEQIQDEKDKKTAAQKTNSYLRNEIKGLREKYSCLREGDHDQCYSEVIRLKQEIEEKQMEINSLQQEIEEINSSLEQINIQMKNSDGSFSDSVRLCIMELAGLEVAVEKVAPVLGCVAKHLFGKDLEKKDLPCASTVQAVVDEGHFVAKSFIAEKMENAKNWGLGRDGTTRKKQKIVDTSITLDSGDVMSLGFTRVASETAKTIQQVTENLLNELGKVSRNLSDEEFIAESLNKLSFTMSDRASNEKLADKLLDNWRNEMLDNIQGEKSSVHHFHCMAHVLLGFHNYLSPELKVLESELAESNGPIGRAALPVFKFWNKRESFVDRVVRTTSDVFGPAGDHHGVRDKWEAFCSVNGIKSVIGNYRDNRFNAIFQTSAEVFYHREDFVKVLEIHERPNLKLQSVKSDLLSVEVCALLQCLGLYYVKVTGPYWNLVTSGQVPYFELYKHVQDKHKFLELCAESPQTLLQTDSHWTESDPFDVRLTKHFNLFELKEETREILLKAIPIVANSMLKTINKQLVDFLPGGQYSNSDSLSDSEKEKTKFAPATNLSCEHHFGDLDSSQRRRPNSTFHHHTSVQLLKRNRSQMMKWIDELDTSEKVSLLQRARKGGRDLRKSHIQNEKDVLTEINEAMCSKKKKNKKRKTEVNIQNKNKKVCYEENEENYSDAEEEAKLLEMIPTNKPVSVNEYVAIAYQDAWYPGIVVNVKNSENFVVKFMSPASKPGHYKWPLREDRQTVEKHFLISAGFMPDCLNSGRLWNIKEAQIIDNIFKKYAMVYFN